MGAAHGGESGSLLSALKNIATTLLAGGKTRLELLGNEIEEEKLRVVRLVIIGQAMMFCLGIGIVLGVAWLTTLLWESRAVVIGGFAALFLVLAGVLVGRFREAAQRQDRIFAASLAELEEDLRQLKAALGHEPPTR